MGLKKEGTPGEAAPSQTVNPAAAVAPPPAAEAPPAAAKPPAPAAPAKKAEAGKKGQKTLALRAKSRMISDPFTGVVYTTEIGKPGISVPGNWIDCQVAAGVLIECSASVLDE